MAQERRWWAILNIGGGVDGGGSPCHAGIMPKRLSKLLEPDVNQLPHHLVAKTTRGVEDKQPAAISTGRLSAAEISRVMSAMGRRGGRIGGKRRLVTLTPEERSKIALKAARARWSKNAGKDH